MTIETESDVVALQRIGGIVSFVLSEMLKAAEPGMRTRELDALGAQPVPDALGLCSTRLIQIALGVTTIQAVPGRIAYPRGQGMAHQQHVVVGLKALRQLAGVRQSENMAHDQDGP